MNKRNMRFVAMVAAILCLAAMAPPAGAQSTPLVTTTLQLTNANIAGNATGQVVGQTNLVWIQPQGGFAFWPTMVGVHASAGTSNMTFRFQASEDGTTWCDTTPISVAIAANGTTTQRGYAAFGPGNPTSTQVIQDARYVRLYSVANGSPTNVILTDVKITRNRE